MMKLMNNHHPILKKDICWKCLLLLQTLLVMSALQVGPDIGGSIRVEDVNDADELTLRKPILSWCGSVLDDHLCTCVKRLVS